MKEHNIKIPKNEIAWVSYYNLKGDLIFVMTSNQIRDCYYLYEVKNGGLKRVAKGVSPIDIEEKVNINEVMRS